MCLIGEKKKEFFIIRMIKRDVPALQRVALRERRPETYGTTAFSVTSKICVLETAAPAPMIM